MSAEKSIHSGKKPGGFAKILRLVGIVLGSLVLLIALIAGGLYVSGNTRLTRKYTVQTTVLQIPTDTVSIEQGRHWAVALCAHCHGADLSGKLLLDDPSLGYIPAPNLTGGEGGAGAEFSDADWVRALREGIDPEGRALIGMPSMNYYYMSDKDLGSLIAYIKTVPPVNHEMGEPSMHLMGKLLIAGGAFGPDILPAEVINHSGTRPAAVDPGVNAQYGEYLVRLGGCRDCHGKDLTGGHSPEPGSPLAPDLTSNGTFGPWSQETFISAVRTMDGRGMPWDELKPLSDPELKAIYLYLHSPSGE